MTFFFKYFSFQVLQEEIKNYLEKIDTLSSDNTKKDEIINKLKIDVQEKQGKKNINSLYQSCFVCVCVCIYIYIFFFLLPPSRMYPYVGNKNIL